jgi:hypothetical protein
LVPTRKGFRITPLKIVLDDSPLKIVGDSAVKNCLFIIGENVDIVSSCFAIMRIDLSAYHFKSCVQIPRFVRDDSLMAVVFLHNRRFDPTLLSFRAKREPKADHARAVISSEVVIIGSEARNLPQF